MTGDPRAAAGGRSRARTPFLVGFLLGFLVTVPAAVLALVLPAAERLAPFLTPGVALLRPLSPAMASWPGAVNLLVGSVANGLVVGAAAAAVAVGLRLWRR